MTKATVFPNVRAQNFHSVNEPWDVVIQYLISPHKTYANKLACPLFKMASFGDIKSSKGSLRHDENVLEVTGIEGDYDIGDMKPEAAFKLLEENGIEAVVYTSASHTDDNPRWRVIAPLDTPIKGTPSELKRKRGHYLTQLEEMLGVKMAPESFALSQTFFFGKVENVKFESYHSEGDPIDLLVSAPKDEVVLSVVPDNPFAGANDEDSFDLVQVIDDIHTGANYHVSTIKLAAHLNAIGCSRRAAIEYMQTVYRFSPLRYIDPKWQDRFDKIEDAFDSAVDKFGTNIQWVDLSPPNKQGKQTPLATKENLEVLIDYCGVDLRYDVYSRALVAWHEGKESTIGIDSIVSSLAVRHGLPVSAVDRHLDKIAQERPINKPLAWLSDLPKPSGDPLAEWLAKNGLMCPIDEPETHWNYIAFNRWFISACAMADQAMRTTNNEAIRKAELCLTMVSGQGTKKTTAMQRLLPKEIRDYFQDGVLLHADNKDSVIRATGSWIVELGEIDATFRKSDIAAIKAFLSNRYDEIRMPYDRRSAKYPRRTAFIATVNETRFLRDTTGNRRFLPVTIEQRLTFDENIGQKIWAQAWYRYLDGEQWWLTDSEEVIGFGVQEKHTGNDLTDMILDGFDFDSEARDNHLRPGEILEYLGFKGVQVARHTHSLHGAITLLKIEKSSAAVRERRYGMPPFRKVNQFGV